jgi:monovalent cation:H+ antiporter, CPA1 family
VSTVSLAILVIALLLAFVSLMAPLAARLRVPHAVLTAALGLALGFLLLATRQARPDFEPVADFLRGVGAIQVDAPNLLVLFLPVLLFTGGLVIDVRRMWEEIAAVILLAVVAVVLCTFAVGLLLDRVADAGLVTFLLLGAIVATTDPSSVLSAFRDLGAPHRLGVLVEGESLLNDAAAIALVAALLAAITGKAAPGLGLGALNFIVDFLGGIAAGGVIARLACAIMPRIGAVAAEVTLTLALAYVAYIVSDHYLGVSGVTAVAAAALTFSAYGRTRLSPDSWAVLVATWRQLEFWASSLIFLFAVILAARYLDNFRFADLWLLVGVIAAALGSRAIVLYGLLPVLEAADWVQPVEKKYKVIILCGGLRGAVTIVLALAVAEAPGVPTEVGRTVAVLAIGFALFTLLIGAPSLRPILALVGLDRLGPVERTLGARVRLLTRRNTLRQLQEIAASYGLDPKLAERGANLTEPAEAEPEIPQRDRARAALFALAARERQFYLELFGAQILSQPIAARLVAIADGLADRAKSGGVKAYRQGASLEIALGRGYRLAHWLHRHLGWSGALAESLAERFEMLVNVELALLDLQRFNRGQIQDLFGKEAMASLEDLIETRLATVRRALSAVSTQYPAYVEALRTAFLTRAALRIEAASYRQSFEEGAISGELFDDLEHDIEAHRGDLKQRPELDLGLRISEMVGKLPIFEKLTKPQIGLVVRLLKPRLVLPAERIIVKGQKGDAMYFIVSGEVEVQAPTGQVRLGPGQFFGELALLTRLPRNADVVALGYCDLLALDGRAFRRLLRSNAALKVGIEEVAKTRLGLNIAEREVG